MTDNDLIMIDMLSGAFAGFVSTVSINHAVFYLVTSSSEQKKNELDLIFM